MNECQEKHFIFQAKFSELGFSYRSVALLILVHGGSTHWNRLIEKLITDVQEPYNTSFQLAESIFDELLSYCNNLKLKESYCVSSLLQVWTCLVLSSKSSNQHHDRTSKLKLFAMEIQEHGTDKLENHVFNSSCLCCFTLG